MFKMLSDVNVVEMGTFITGPAAGMFLADLGADVIKVERPEIGDPFRAFNGELYSPHFQTYNRNKRSVELNTKSDSDLEEFDKLIRQADVFIENFRPGVAKKLRVDYERLKQINPKLVYCSISGFGPDGPDALKPAFDTVAQAATGFLRLLLNPANPRVVGPAIADAITGFYASQGILAALFARQKSNESCLVEISMLEAMSHFNLDDFTHYLSADLIMGPESRPNVSQSYVFECKDKRWIALHMSSPTKFWTGLAEAVGHPNMLSRSEFASRESRIENYDKVVEFLKPLFLAKPSSYWCERLVEIEVPHSLVLNSKEALETPQAIHMNLCVQTEHPQKGIFKTVRSPLRFNGEANLDVLAPPVLGEHNGQEFNG
ncbi:CaiB/BaiF CoA-transferase family protein [Aliiglaciecola sp. LCG003]|uniref:CaiB/BaiF CoA transferase family protein n=1 Tax=Aliiglaciecola sp. LCG003 TaxID=3053655 RepID=UPI00257283E7|nr:CaiB/BaiF CoA-transferase family protein [Aliiglaciecola sp. LCG003]WJG08170.1 CaiB/BaiF CoA-transferase family protein [Aliiglaciecola sp. LCG003]